MQGIKRQKEEICEYSQQNNEQATGTGTYPIGISHNASSRKSRHIQLRMDASTIPTAP